jgi:hypothetical protein
MSVGIASLAEIAPQQAIIAEFSAKSLHKEAEAFRHEFGLDVPEPMILVDRIAAARAQLAYAKRGNLPEPSELAIVRPTPSRRQRQRQERNSIQ